jgi:hypothetical protein
MNRLLSALFLLFTVLGGIQSNIIDPSNNCISFTVGQGTGCAWMCNYCSDQLGTNNYYFTDDICTYQNGGCVGNPVAGKQYTCCAVSEVIEQQEL